MIGILLADRYRLDAVLGQGGMGIVYRGYDMLLDRPVAIKILGTASQAHLGIESRARLLHEAQAAARLNHPNIVSIYDAGEAVAPGQAEGALSQPSPFIVMELLEGQSLYERKPTTIEEILSIARQVCAALEHAHAHGVIHRDLKPENIIVQTGSRENSPSVKLTDFGLARSLASPAGGPGQDADGSASMMSMMVGSVFYLAPESIGGSTSPSTSILARQPVDGRADLYSLGVILYELTTGQLPFNADDPLAVISQHLYATPVPPRLHRPEIPAALEELILALLSKQPEKRPASAAEVRQALETLETRENAAHMDAASLELLAAPQGEALTIQRLMRGRLVGRQRELAQMDAIWRQAAAGEGHTLIVTGESGIGKTRLVHELLARATVLGGQALAGNCYPEGGIPYAPFSQMIGAQMQTLPTESTPTRDLGLPDYILADLAKISPELGLLYHGLPANPAPGSGGRLLSSSLKPDASGGGSPPPWLEIERRSEQQRLSESLAAWIAALAARAPVLLFVDDAHWADSGTLFLLRSLARRAPRLRLLIVLTYRETELTAITGAETSHLQSLLVDLNRERLSTRLKLARFDLEATRQMLETMLTPRRAIDPELANAIFRETEGNPFFIEEVTKSLLEEGKLCLEDVCWAAQNPADLDIPQSVRAAIGSRLARLPVPAQETLRLAAVIGRQFEFDILQESSDLDEDTLIDVLEVAERAQLIHEAGAEFGRGGRPAAQVFSFEHALIPATLREDMSSLRRQRLHRRVATALEAKRDEISCCYETLAYHYEQGGDAPNALKYYGLAGDQALDVSANQEAEGHYRAALELEPADPERACLLSALGEALFRQSRYTQAGETWLQASEVDRTLGDHDQVARQVARAARAAWYAGEARRGLALCRQGMDTIGEMTGAGMSIPGPSGHIETHGMAALIHETARACHFNDLQEEALGLCQQALEVARRLSLVDVQADTLATLGLLPNLSYEERQKALTEAVELAEGANLPSTAARAHINLGEFLHKAGDLPEARKHYLRARELARQVGIAAWEHGFIGLAADLSLDMGEYAEVENAIQAMRDLHADLPDPQPAAYYTRLLEAHLARLRGEWVQAIQLYQQCRVEAQGRNDHKGIAVVDVHLGETLSEMGAYDQAEETLRDVVRRNEERGLTLQSATPLFLLSSVYLHQGRPIETRAALEKARLYAGMLGAHPTPGSPRHQALSQWGEARLAAAEKDWEAAFAGYEALVKTTVRISAPWHQAHALAEWAEARLAHGQAEDTRLARELLEAAHAIYIRLGIPNHAARIEKALAALEIAP